MDSAADITLCDDIVRRNRCKILVGKSRRVARYDFADHDSDSITNEWISAMRSGSSGLTNNDPRAVTCDEVNDILYIGYDTEGVGIDRTITTPKLTYQQLLLQMGLAMTEFSLEVATRQ